MKKLLALIKTKGKSKEQIKDELLRTLKNKGMLDEKGRLKGSIQQEKKEF